MPAMIARRHGNQSTAKIHVLPPLPFFVFLRDLKGYSTLREGIRDFVVRSRLAVSSSLYSVPDIFSCRDEHQGEIHPVDR